VFGNIIQRMIFREIAKVFVLSLLGITGILLMAGIVAEATQQGLSPAQILAIIPLLIPSTLPYTIPATTLFATCVVYGRLAADNEILAIKAAGINIRMVVWPAVLLGLLMSATTMGLYYHLIPYTHSLMRTMFLNDVEESLYTVLRKDRAINQPRLNYSMWVQKVQGRKLIEPLFKRRNARGDYDVVAKASEAELRVDITNQQIILNMRNGLVSIEGGTSAYFQERMWEVPLPELFKPNRQRRPRSMTWTELLDHRQAQRQVVADRTEEIALVSAQTAAGTAASDAPLHLKNLEEGRQTARLEVTAVDAELYMRPALALGCLCFVLLGCPTGMRLSKSDYLSAFISCFLPIVLFYYPIMLCGTNFARDGYCHPAVSILAADVLTVIAGLVLFRVLVRS
jgi:lipopolysaccharide export system permease protein